MNIIIWTQSRKSHQPDILIINGKLIATTDINRASVVKHIVDTYKIGEKISNQDSDYSISKYKNDYVIKLHSGMKDEFNRPLPAYIFLENLSEQELETNLEKLILASAKKSSIRIKEREISEYLILINSTLKSKNNKTFFLMIFFIVTLIILIVLAANDVSIISITTPTASPTATITPTLTSTPIVTGTP